MCALSPFNGRKVHEIQMRTYELEIVEAENPFHPLAAGLVWNADLSGTVLWV